MDTVADHLLEAEQEAKHSAKEQRDLARWQYRLLPLMTRFVVVLAVVFFCFSAVHLYQVSEFIRVEHGRDIRSLIESQIAKPQGQPATAEEVLQNSLLLLEADSLDKRYHQASALLLSRIWSRQLAFITGMVMAFLGAVFILGKMSESTSNISGGNPHWSFAISSASPGIILSFFGTVLLVTSLLIRATLDVSDGPAYISALRRAADTPATGNAVPGQSRQQTPSPLTLQEMERLGKQARPSGEKLK